MPERKHVLIEKQLWKTLHELKIKWEKKSLSEVIKELLRRVDVERD
jgi:predicted CopG family antitoxin